MNSTERLILAVFVFSIGLSETFAGITGIENAIAGDPTLLTQVLSMETTNNPESWRAIHSPTLAILSGVLIMLTHWTSGLLCLYAAFQIGISKRKDSIAEYARAKIWATAGIGLGCVLYLFGFVTLASAWFQLWQSPTINFIPEAQMLFFCYMFVLLYSRSVD